MSERKLKHVESQFSEKLFSRLAAHGETFGSFRDVFAHFRSYDPSRTGAYTTWLIKTYVENGFLFEDLAKAKETLQWFDEVKRRLSVERRNIADYPTLADVWKAVKPFVEEPETVDPSKREQRRKEQDEVYTETIFLEETDDYRVVIPLTERASKWWGKGTRWCTAADKKNMFLEYFKYAPLIIFDFKNGHKWQLYSSKNLFQLMDENDAEVNKNDVGEKWSIINKYILFLIPSAKTDELFKFIPDIVMSRDFIMNSLKKDGYTLKYVPSQLRDFDMCSVAVNGDGRSLEFVPHTQMTEELVLAAVRNDGRALKHVPPAFVTDEVRLEAVRQNGRALSHIDHSKLTDELCDIAVKSNGFALHCMSPEQKTYARCLEAVKTCGGAIRSVPSLFRTKELCEIAVGNAGYVFKEVPDDLKTIELFLKAVESDPDALYDFPEDYKTPEVFERVVEIYGRALKYIPRASITNELCIRAFEHKNMNVLSCIPFNMRKKDICLLGIKSVFDVIDYVPEGIRTEDFMHEYETLKNNKIKELATTNGIPDFVEHFLVERQSSLIL